ncbi:hypothetical protein IMAU20120_02324 [Lactiplantibacillus plantarum]|nr:hypothetical protein [Lactiplantibacillus plantarum]MCG0665379.1 hypothetical protein [Lactiplantibacillus plantarum]MCG0671785.1 hypothetical protein [Lactiplantibacillus plantarum]MCG0813413.1 hypothetical protein [Lactiplantibacillus plantarum]MCG0873119.1 hypothetical protein [Lactiplantibacillus plantarum]
MKFAGNLTARPAVGLMRYDQAKFTGFKLLIVTSKDVLVVGYEDISLLLIGNYRDRP